MVTEGKRPPVSGERENGGIGVLTGFLVCREQLLENIEKKGIKMIVGNLLSLVRSG